MSIPISSDDEHEIGQIKGNRGNTLGTIIPHGLRGKSRGIVRFSDVVAVATIKINRPVLAGRGDEDSRGQGIVGRKRTASWKMSVNVDHESRDRNCRATSSTLYLHAILPIPAKLRLADPNASR